MENIVRAAGVAQDSIVDGPGLRLCLFVQGCPHHCPGCHNPETHDPKAGYDLPVKDILQKIRENPLLDGVTLSGGEPLCQPRPLAYLAEEARKMEKNVWLYSGFTWDQILKMREEDPDVRRLLGQVDVLVDGPFLQSQRSLELRFRGSSNQRLIDVPKSLASLCCPPILWE
nr:anaerobic ribonucleoside-triphosphate reductase activating protein [uncultured Solibaculum sp.]